MFGWVPDSLLLMWNGGGVILLLCALIGCIILAFFLLEDKRARIVITGLGVIVLAFFFTSVWVSRDAFYEEKINRIITQAVNTQEEVFQDIQAYTPSKLDLTTLNPQLKSLLEDDAYAPASLKIIAAPVTNKLVMRAEVEGKEVERTLQGSVISEASLTSTQIERLAGS